jgi:hypothetical protein
MDIKEEITHREFYNRSRDIIRVYNPLDVDFRFKFDSIWYKVPSHSQKDMERYLAGKFFHDISNNIINYMAYEAGSKMLKDREAKGLGPFLNKYDENRAIWDNTPTTGNKELLEHIASEVILGLVEEFGSEPGPMEATPKAQTSLVPLTDQIMNKAVKSPLKEVEDEVPTKPIIGPAIDTTTPNLAQEATVQEEAPLYVSKKDKEKTK